MNGIELIAAERCEQLVKHGFTLERDQQYEDGQLVRAAVAILEGSSKRWPWPMAMYSKIMEKAPAEQLAIAGALLAAEIDRVLSPLPMERNHDEAGN